MYMKYKLFTHFTNAPKSAVAIENGNYQTIALDNTDNHPGIAGVRASPSQAAADQSTDARNSQELKESVDELARNDHHHKSKARASIAHVQHHVPLSHLMPEPVENQQQQQQQENLSTTSLILLHSANSAPAQQPDIENTSGTAIYATPPMLPSFSHYSAGKSSLSSHLNSTLRKLYSTQLNLPQVNTPQLNLHSTQLVAGLDTFSIV